MSKVKQWYPHVVSTMALVVALTMGGAYAKQRWIDGTKIKPGSITSAKVKNGTLKAADFGKGQITARAIGRGQVRAAAIGRNQVTAAAIAPNQVGQEQIAPAAVGSAEIASSAISSSQLQDGSVQSGDIANGQVTSDDIGDGQVTPDDMTLPPPATLSIPADQTSAAAPTREFIRITTVGSYRKMVADSVLEVSWTGSTATDSLPCVFQLRVDGQPGARSGGEIYVANSSVLSVSSTALFEGIGVGEHEVSIWARIPNYPGDTDSKCTVGPAFAGIPQTVIVSEELS